MYTTHHQVKSNKSKSYSEKYHKHITYPSLNAYDTGKWFLESSEDDDSGGNYEKFEHRNDSKHFKG